MEINIRKSVLANINEMDYDEIYSTITDAITQGEEVTLPGLGVMFEVAWNKANEEQKNKFVQHIHDSLK